MADWDHHKENIQPQRKGHSSKHLQRICKKRNEEEEAIFQKELKDWENRVRVDAPEGFSLQLLLTFSIYNQ